MNFKLRVDCNRLMTSRAFFMFMILGNLFSFKSKGQNLKTDDAKPLDAHQIHLETTFEFGKQTDLKEFSWNANVKYRLSKEFMISTEVPVVTSIDPDSGASATGLGDAELTLFLKVVEENKIRPFFSIALETKFPTARNELIGTGKIDFTPLFIANKTTGKFFTTINLGYTIIGKPKGVTVYNLFDYGIATIFTPVSKSLLFCEVYGNRSFSEQQNDFSAGYGYAFKNGWLLSFAIGYGSNSSLLVGAGIEWESAKRKLKNAILHLI